MKGTLKPVGIFLLGVVLTATAVFWLGKAPCLVNCVQVSTSDVLLKSIQEMNEFKPNTGNFVVAVKLKKEAITWLPDLIDSYKATALAEGSIDTLVDFNKLSQDNIVMDGDTITITLPEPYLGKPNLDLAKTEIVAESKGIGTKVKDFFHNDPEQLKKLYLSAEGQFAAKAKESGQIEAGKATTETMLSAMLGTALKAAGQSDVQVKVEWTPAPAI